MNSLFLRKAGIALTMLLILSVGLVACAAGEEGPAGPQGPQGPAGPQGSPGEPAIQPIAQIAVTPSVAELHKNTQVVLTGSGFQPGQEVRVMFVDEYENPTILEVVTVDERGSWAWVWTVGRYTRRGILAERIYTFTAQDAEGNILASAPLGLVDTTEPQEEWPEWGQVLIEE